jgi:hypothetical protein
MDALTLLTFQATTADDLLTQVFAPVTAAQGAWHPDGSTANAITPTFLHVYICEDRLVSGATGRQLLWDSEGWGRRLGLDPANPWVAPPMNDLEPCRAYAGAVRAATKAFLPTLDADALGREIPTPRGQRPLGEALAFALVLNKVVHLGEIAALLGCQGERGFPF